MRELSKSQAMLIVVMNTDSSINDRTEGGRDLEHNSATQSMTDTICSRCRMSAASKRGSHGGRGRCRHPREAAMSVALPLRRDDSLIMQQYVYELVLEAAIMNLRARKYTTPPTTRLYGRLISCLTPP